MHNPSGNLTVIPGTGGATYTYNGESELTTTTAGVTYTYDGDGQRVEKSNGTLFWYGMGGEVLEETALNGGFMEDYVFFAGSRVARMDSSKDIFAYFEDHLGTARVMQKIAPGASTSTLVYDADFRPYGRESILTQTGNPLYKFDGKLRDTETGLDDFGARYYSFTIGRFMSADWSSVPAPVPYANLTNPQTLNLYAIVSDNPETYADLDGHEPDGATDAQDSATDGAPPQCPVEGCPVYEIDYADGPLDTSQAQNNADARDDATTDGTQQQTTGAAVANHVQTVLDVATFIPVVGDVASGVNAVISAARGNWTDAGISALAAIPVIGAVGEVGKAAKLGKEAEEGLKATKEAEKLYPKLAGKYNDHHIIPKYLGGAKDGKTARIPAAYHQLITNEFRKLAPYGRQIERSAEEVGQILQQVYSKFPIF